MSITYAIGDIHGRIDCLERLLTLIARDARKNRVDRPKIITLGDYVDRGPNSRAVLERLAAGLDWAELIALKGNHDAMVSAYLEDGDDNQQVNWLRNGVKGYAEFFREADIPVHFPPEIFLNKKRRAFRHYVGKAARSFLKTLLRYYADEGQNILFVHAGIRPGIALSEQTEDDLTHIREDFLQYSGPLPYSVVHGHTVVGSIPSVSSQRICVDTNAQVSGILTAAVFDSETPDFVRFLQTGGRTHLNPARFRVRTKSGAAPVAAV